MAQTKHDALDLPNFDLLWNYDNPGETEKKFREILTQAENSGDTSYLIQLITQIARAQGLQMKFDDAHKTLDSAEKLNPKNYEKY